MESQRLHWLPSCTLSGDWQMAIDAWLLEQVVGRRRHGPLLRFYRWRRPTLSLGRHQARMLPHWLELAAAGQLDLVRRPTGGAAVLHGGDLTYALVWPDAPRQRREAYRLSCRWLQEAFAALGQPLAFGDAPCGADQANCFATSTAADLVHPGGPKRIGSAQLWRSRCLLQHGSIALDPDRALWEAVFGTPAPRLAPLPLCGSELEVHLLDQARHWFPLGSHRSGEEAIGDPLQSWEWRGIAPTLGTFQVCALPLPRSAVSARDRATGSRARPMG